MCVKVMRAASPPGHRHGFDENGTAAPCLNDVFAEVGAVHADRHAWAGGELT